MSRFSLAFLLLLLAAGFALTIVSGITGGDQIRSPAQLNVAVPANG